MNTRKLVSYLLLCLMFSSSGYATDGFEIDSNSSSESITNEILKVPKHKKVKKNSKAKRIFAWSLSLMSFIVTGYICSKNKNKKKSQNDVPMVNESKTKDRVDMTDDDLVADNKKINISADGKKINVSTDIEDNPLADNKTKNDDSLVDKKVEDRFDSQSDHVDASVGVNNNVNKLVMAIESSYNDEALCKGMLSFSTYCEWLKLVNPTKKLCFHKTTQTFSCSDLLLNKYDMCRVSMAVGALLSYIGIKKDLFFDTGCKEFPITFSVEKKIKKSVTLDDEYGVCNQITPRLKNLCDNKFAFYSEISGEQFKICFFVPCDEENITCWIAAFTTGSYYAKQLKEGIIRFSSKISRNNLWSFENNRSYQLYVELG